MVVASIDAERYQLITMTLARCKGHLSLTPMEESDMAREMRLDILREVTEALKAALEEVTYK